MEKAKPWQATVFRRHWHRAGYHWASSDQGVIHHHEEPLVADGPSVQQAEELLIDLDSLIEWSIFPADLPLPQNPKKRPEHIRKVSEKSDSVELVDIGERQGSLHSKLV